MAPDQTERLRVLVANERDERLDAITAIVNKLGHDVVARNVGVDKVSEHTRAELPDVALVGLGVSSEHALKQISEIVREAACPVIALLHDGDPDFVNEAAKRGVFAHITDDDPAQLQSTLDIVLRRFAEYHNLEGAFTRRAMIERAKGILMATHVIDDEQAFELLRRHSQQNGIKLLDLAEAVVHSHRLLAPQPPPRHQR